MKITQKHNKEHIIEQIIHKSLYENKTITLISQELGISRPTINKYIKEHQELIKSPELKTKITNVLITEAMNHFQTMKTILDQTPVDSKEYKTNQKLYRESRNDMHTTFERLGILKNHNKSNGVNINMEQKNLTIQPQITPEEQAVQEEITKRYHKSLKQDKESKIKSLASLKAEDKERSNVYNE